MGLHQKTLIAICFACSIAGLILIYIAAANIEPTIIPIKKITSEYIGKSVTTKGYIAYKNSHLAGHLFLTIADGDAKIQVPLFSGYMKSLEQDGLDAYSFQKGNTISVTGLVDEYKGDLQIIPRKPNDIKIVRD